MGKRTIFDQMKKNVEKELEGKQLELLSLSEGETTDKETGYV